MSVLQLKLLSDPSNFKKGIDGAIKELHKFERTFKTVGSGMNKALGAVGLAAGITGLTRVLKDSARAASEDIKSQALLANALKNTVGATSATIAGAEEYIKKTQLQSAVLDDELRPALAQATRATGSLAGGEKLLNTALNVSAGTGKDLGTVVGALSKAYNGNTTSLKKLIPGLDVTGNYMDALDKSFAGAAETAANNDPYKKISIIFSELQETIGMTLLPALQEFSAYLSSPEGQSNLRQIASIFQFIGTLIANATKFLVQNIAIIKAVVGALVFVKLAWGVITFAVKAYEIATKIATISTKALRTALITTGIGALVVAVGLLAGSWMDANAAAEDYADTTDTIYNPDRITLKDSGFTSIDPATGLRVSNVIANDAATTLQQLFTDTRFTKEIKQALLKLKGKEVVIDFGLNAIFSGGKKVWQGIRSDVVEGSKALREALDKEINSIKSTAEKFRGAIGIAFGAKGTDENSIFNVDYLLGKLRRVAQAAKGFAENLANLRKKGADQSFISELVAMGPAQGNIAAKALLASGGKLSEILGLRGDIYGVGVGAATQSSLAGNATYEININKATVSASDIIKEIQIYEKKTGRKYLVTP
jgi:uncharacterized protein YcfJ